MTVQTSFQTETVRALTALLATHGREAKHELRKGVVPFLSRDPMTCVKLESDDLEVWIFEDDAAFRGSKGSAAHERDDFESEEALREALLSDIAAML